MPRRLFLTLIALGLTSALTAAPVSAGGGSLVIGNAEGGIGAGFTSTLGGPWQVGVSGCPSGAYFDIDRYRSALEFPLADLPPGATILSATLSLTDGTITPAFNQHAVYGYAGDGSITEPDIQVGGTPIHITPTSNSGPEDYDVTGLLTPAMVSAGWAGFSIRPDPDAVTLYDLFVCGPGFIEALGPVLTIAYDLPNQPTPVASGLPNAAMGSSTDTSPLLALGFALLLVGSLGTLAFATARRR